MNIGGNEQDRNGFTGSRLKFDTQTFTNSSLYLLKGNSHQILLSEMSLPGIEVHIEKLLPKILGRLGKENPSKRRCKVAFVQRKCSVTSSVRFLYAICTLCTTSQAKISVCMQGSRGCCPACVCILELFVRVSTAVRYASKCCVTSHNTTLQPAFWEPSRLRA